jgi:hypothetical protein
MAGPSAIAHIPLAFSPEFLEAVLALTVAYLRPVVFHRKAARVDGGPGAGIAHGLRSHRFRRCTCCSGRAVGIHRGPVADCAKMPLGWRRRRGVCWWRGSDGSRGCCFREPLAGIQEPLQELGWPNGGSGSHQRRAPEDSNDPAIGDNGEPLAPGRRLIDDQVELSGTPPVRRNSAAGGQGSLDSNGNR